MSLLLRICYEPRISGHLIMRSSVLSTILLIIVLSSCTTNALLRFSSYVSVDVHSNSPVTVGSIITFHAALLNLSHSLRNESFVYLWTNDVANHSTGFFDITATTAETTSHMSKVFSLHVPPGRYLMKVQVFRKQDVWLKAFSHLHPVAVGFHSFTLSDRNASEPRVPAYLPVFCVLIAVSALSAILWSAFYCRRNFPDVEEANFEFYHLSIQGLNYRHQDPVTIRMVARKAKRAWGFWRVRAYRKVRDVLWQPEPPCDENEMQEVTGRLLSGLQSYGSTGTTVVNS